MIVVLMGIAGTGKSTIGALLARELGCSFLDGDDEHPPGNVAKMARGEPLTDDDRWPWLDRIRSRILEAESKNESLVVACSALKRVYRERLAPNADGIDWVYLTGNRDLIEQRLTARSSHFMKASMLESQLAALEAPNPTEALWVDIANDPAELVGNIAHRLRR